MWSFVRNAFSHSALRFRASSMYQCFVPFCGCIVFHCVHRPRLFTYPSTDGCLGCSHFLAVPSSAAMDIHVQVSPMTYISVSLGSTPWSGIAGPRGTSGWNHLRNGQPVFQSGCTVYPSSALSEGSCLPTPLLDSHR